VVVQRDIDVVGVAELLDRAERLGFRLGHKGLDADLAPELEHSPAARVVARMSWM